MTLITDFMSDDHRSCDEVFARAETLVAKGNWQAAAAALRDFTAMLESHFAAEEEILFPGFEAATGMTGGPTQVMRMEHAEMREALERMADALSRQDGDDYSGEAETLLILMQQHNMKEENILYPMCDSELAAQRGELSPRLTARMAEGRQP